MSFPHVAHGADKGSVEPICPPVGSVPKTRLLLALTLFSIQPFPLALGHFSVCFRVPSTVQRSPLFCAPGLVKFIPAVARLFCLALPGSFLTMFAQNKGDLCTLE